MKLPIKIVAVSGILLGALSIAGIAYALTAASFESRAQAWADAVCKQSLLDSKNTTANNKTIAICQAYLKGKENGATLASQQLSINNLLNVIPTPGPKGDTGAPGEAGPKGDRGDVGPKGDTGATIEPMLEDANGVEIGYRAGVEEIYVPSIRRVIAYGPSQPVGTIVAQAIWYITTDCSGIGYTSSRGVGAYGQPKLYAYNSFNGLFTVADNTVSTLIRPGSLKGVNGVCTQLNPDNYAVEGYSAVSFVSVPFAIPLAVPLKFK